MVTIRINKSNIKAFWELDPYERLDMLALPGAFALGMVDEQEEEDVPAALMICTREKDRLVIDWMYTLPEYRGQGCASSLMILAFEEALGRGLTEVAARISSEYEDNGADWDSEGFFVNDVFSFVEEGESVFRSNVKQLEKRLKEDEKKNELSSGLKELVSIGDLSDSDLDVYAEKLEKQYGLNFVYPVRDMLMASDKAVSVLRVEKGECNGAFLVMKSGRTWYTLGLIPMNYEDAEELIRAVLHRFQDSLMAGDLVEVMLRSSAAGKVLEQMKLEGDTYEVCYYTASVDSFRKRKEEMEDYEG